MRIVYPQTTNRMKLFALFITFLTLISGCTQQIKEVRIPFEYDELIYLELTLNDSIKGKFIFDTGAKGLYLDSTFVANSSIEQTFLGETEVENAETTKHKPIPIVKHAIHFKFGKKTYRSNQTPILDLSEFSKDGIAGILGVKFFKNSILKINFEEKYFAVFDPSYRGKLVQLNHIDYKMVNDRIFTHALITVDSETSFSGTFEINLGCTDDVLLTPQAARKHDLFEKSKNAIKLVSFDNDGSADARMYDLRANSIIFGESSVRKILLSFAKDNTEKLSDYDYEGVIGVPLLARFNFYIDFPDNIIFFDPLKNVHKKYSATTSGFKGHLKSFGDNSFIIVHTIYSPSAATQAGLHLGDTIVKINKRKIGDIPKEDLDHLLNTAGIDLILLVRDGSTEKTIQYISKEII